MFLNNSRARNFVEFERDLENSCGRETWSARYWYWIQIGVRGRRDWANIDISKRHAALRAFHENFNQLAPVEQRKLISETNTAAGKYYSAKRLHPEYQETDIEEFILNDSNCDEATRHRRRCPSTVPTGPVMEIIAEIGPSQRSKSMPKLRNSYHTPLEIVPLQQMNIHVESQVSVTPSISTGDAIVTQIDSNDSPGDGSQDVQTELSEFETNCQPDKQAEVEKNILDQKLRQTWNDRRQYSLRKRKAKIDDKGKSSLDSDLYCVCRQPFNPNRSYVCCDSCDEWFHCSCMNISEKKARTVETWMCRECKKKNMLNNTSSDDVIQRNVHTEFSEIESTGQSHKKTLSEKTISCKKLKQVSNDRKQYSLRKRKEKNGNKKKSLHASDLYCVCRQPFNPNRSYVCCDSCDEWFHCSCMSISEKKARTVETWMCRECKKNRQALAEKVLYCVCRQPYDKGLFYVGCDTCHDWFHPECIGVTKEYLKECDEFMCPKCQESV